MQVPQLSVEFEHGFAEDYLLDAREDIDDHDDEAKLECDGEVSNLLICISTRLLKSIEGLIDEVSD